MWRLNVCGAEGSLRPPPSHQVIASLTNQTNMLGMRLWLLASNAVAERQLVEARDPLERGLHARVLAQIDLRRRLGMGLR
jgi:hypothetical protein